MTINNLRISTLLAFMLFSASSLADISDNDQRQSACATLELMAKMTAINLILPANHDNLATLQETQNHLVAMNQLACQSVHFNEEIQFENRYDNGRLIITGDGVVIHCCGPMATRRPTVSGRSMKPGTTRQGISSPIWLAVQENAGFIPSIICWGKLARK